MNAAVRLRRSVVVDAPVEDVWRILRDFNGHDRWHPAVQTSAIEAGEPADMVGAVRAFRLRDGATLREQLLSLSDRDRAFSYCLLEAPFPLMGYVAHVSLKPVTDGDRTFWEWRSTFEPPPDRRAELAAMVERDIYGAGFAAVRHLLERRPPSRPAAEPEPLSFRPPPGRAAEVPANVRPRPARVLPADAGSESTNAIVVERYGGPEVLVPRTVALLPPSPGEVRLRHTAIGVNFIDVYCRNGQFDLLQVPGVPGMEAAGVVEAAGADVRDLAPGDRVAYACPPVGAYCERRNVAPDLLVRLSPDIPDTIAAAGLLKGVSASFLLHDVRPVRSGETVLVHAAAGGIGQILVQWAAALGATVIATVSTEEKAALVGRLGAHHVVVYSRDDFAAAVGRITNGRGVDAAFDAVGQTTFAGTLEALAVRGHLVSYGQASGPIGDWDIGRLSAKSVTLSRPNYAHYTDTPEKLDAHVGRFFAALRQGIVRLAEPAIYPLSRAADAHRDLEARSTTGSLVLRPSPG